jgi:hypothetical protein
MGILVPTQVGRFWTAPVQAAAAESELKACRRINVFTAASRTPAIPAGGDAAILRHAALKEETK